MFDTLINFDVTWVTSEGQGHMKKNVAKVVGDLWPNVKISF